MTRIDILPPFSITYANNNDISKKVMSINKEQPTPEVTEVTKEQKQTANEELTTSKEINKQELTKKAIEDGKNMTAEERRNRFKNNKCK